MGWTDAALASSFSKSISPPIFTWFPSEFQAPVNIPLFLAFFVFFLAILLRFFPPATTFPRVGIDPGPFNLLLWPARIDFLLHGPKILEEGYEKFKDTPFMVKGVFVDYLVLPPRFLPELQMLPESKLNSNAALMASTLGVYHGADIILKDHQVSNICRVQLTKNLPTLVPFMEDELHFALSRDLQECTTDAFKPFNAFDVIFDKVTRITSRVFVGEAICRNERWYKEVAAWNKHVPLTVISLLPFPDFLRPVIFPFVPFRWRLKQILGNLRKILFPVPGTLENPAEEEKVNLVNYLVKDSKDGSQEVIMRRLVVLMAAAITGVTNATLYVLYDLCMMPECIAPLREEALSVFRKSGGKWEHSALMELKLLDSFMKESDRFNAPAFLRFSAKVKEPIILSEGTHLEPGMIITMAGRGISHDPRYHKDPLSFIPDRYLPSSSSLEQSQLDFVSATTPNIMTWGKGRMNCPGRWYAVDQMKLIIATLLLAYDFKFPGGQTERPKGIPTDDAIAASKKQEVLFRKRTLGEL